MGHNQKARKPNIEQFSSVFTVGLESGGVRSAFPKLREAIRWENVSVEKSRLARRLSHEATVLSFFRSTNKESSESSSRFAILRKYRAAAGALAVAVALFGCGQMEGSPLVGWRGPR